VPAPEIEQLAPLCHALQIQYLQSGASAPECLRLSRFAASPEHLKIHCRTGRRQHDEYNAGQQIEPLTCHPKNRAAMHILWKLVGRPAVRIEARRRSARAVGRGGRAVRGRQWSPSAGTRYRDQLGAIASSLLMARIEPQ